MSANVAVYLIAALAALGVVGAVFYLLGRRFEHRIGEATGQAGEAKAKRLIEEGQRTADAAKAEAILAGKEEVMKAREDWEQEEKGRRDEIVRIERRLEEREAGLDRRTNTLEEREKNLGGREQSVKDRSAALEVRDRELAAKIEQADKDIARIAGMSLDDAKKELFKRIEEEAKSEAAALVRDVREEAQKSADKEAKKILATAVQRISSEYASEISVSTVTLPSDEMKGRIIGREGRNIRAFETATGVDVIIDDTPDTVVVSCFDPIRREVARKSMEQLIADGRIHPGRIEEVVTKVQEELEQKLVELGEQ
ncbi:MAG: Rnase Y domain-containing protein, partial [Gemmatimonadota bacterium]|nr:Rnase Y domain-containing protein [Gemmatimonadota bacterium]